MRAKNIFYICLSLICILGSCQLSKSKKSGFDLTIKAKNFAKQDLILHYIDVDNNKIREDFTLDDSGLFKLSQVVNVKPNTKCQIVIKGLTQKYKSDSPKANVIRDYILGSYVYFFVSNGSDITVNIDQFDDAGAVNYTLNNDCEINKLANLFNHDFNAKTLQSRILEDKLKSYRSTFLQSLENEKMTEKEKLKAFFKSDKCKELRRQYTNEISVWQFLQDYIKNNRNELSAYYLDYTFFHRVFPEKFYVSQLDEYLTALPECRFVQEAKITMDKRNAFCEGKVIENITGKTLTGEEFELKKINKDYIVLDFWATWCGPCKKGMPEMKKMYEKYNGKIELVGVCCSSKDKDWRKFLDEHKDYNWIQILDQGKRFSELFNIEGLPTKIIVDRSGKIVYRKIGERPEDYGNMEKIFNH